MEISITRALSEIKMLSNRIEHTVNNGIYIAGAKKSSKKINSVFTRDEFNVKAKADYQSAVDLIERRKKIKSAIVESNAKTIVTIDGKQMTVAEAIERKDSIEFEQCLLSELEMQYRNILAYVNRENERVESNLQKLLETSFSREGKQKASEDDINAIANPFKQQNEYEVINPLELQNVIEKLRSQIQGFISEVDFVLSTSNALTMINIPD